MLGLSQLYSTKPIVSEEVCVGYCRLGSKSDVDCDPAVAGLTWLGVVDALRRPTGHADKTSYEDGRNATIGLVAAERCTAACWNAHLSRPINEACAVEIEKLCTCLYYRCIPSTRQSVLKRKRTGPI